jgi:hypothetical protein
MKTVYTYGHPKPELTGKTGTKGARGQKLTKNSARSVKSAKQGPDVSDLEKTLSLITTHPGIRPSELNRLLNREQSDGLRNTLIKRGLVRKERDGIGDAILSRLTCSPPVEIMFASHSL